MTAGRAAGDMKVDVIDIAIIKVLLNEPDISNVDLAKKVGKPLSTVQRRKNDLEKGGVLKKNYELSIQNLGWRVAEILMLVERGRADFMAQELIKRFDNVIGTSTRINTDSNLGAFVGYRDSNELHELLEKIRAMPDVNKIQWSEVVRETGDRNYRLANLMFKSS